MGTTQPIRKDDELYSFRMYYADEKPNVRNYTLIVLGLNTALRIGDLLSLKWSSVYNFQFQSFYDHILIHEQKTGKRNNVLLNATAKDALQAYFNERSPEEGEYIFTKTTCHEKPLNRSQAYRIVKTAAVHTTQEDCISCHSLRKTFGYHAWKHNDDNVYCSSCWDEHNDIIHEYNYTPDLVFHGKGLRHFGVELEIDDGGTVNSNAQKLLDIANKDVENLYIKTDGSLDEGLELVTHPMTLEYHLNEIPWAEVLRKAQSMGYLSHAAGTCGLHVHISRLAFGCTYEQQEAAIARLLYFVEKFWAELLRFSRRTQSQMNRWAARYGIRLTPSEQMNHAKNSCARRYTAVNLTNADTVEIRMFRGTLKLNTLKATLQMVNHLVEVAISMSDIAVQELSWFDFLDNINEPELIQYLKERRLYVNEPVSASEEE